MASRRDCELTGFDVGNDLSVADTHQPRLPRVRPTHPLVLGRPAHPRRHRRVLGTGDFPGCYGVAMVLTCGLTDGSARAEGVSQKSFCWPWESIRLFTPSA